MADNLSHISPVWSRISELVIERGNGCYVYTPEGTPYLDFTSGIGVTNTGHCHPKVVQAIQEQAARAIHAQVNCYFHKPLIELSEALNTITPGYIDSFFFSNSGAEAVEASVKLAKHFTERENIIVFQGGFHGRTAQTMAMTTAKTVYRKQYQPLPSGVVVAPFPHAYLYGVDEATAIDWTLRELDLILKTQTAPEETAAMIIEPVLGEGGYIPAPARFLKGLRAVCDRYGILLIMDEVQSGFGRTGAWFAFEHAGLKPDILVMAKGLGSGFPISGIAAPMNIMEKWQIGTHGGTFGGNPMGCAAALATIQVLQEENLLENAKVRGQQLMEGLKDLQQRYPVIGDIRGLGLMIGCEFTDTDTGEPDSQTAKQVRKSAEKAGRLLLLTCGMYGNTIRWIPPLVVTEAQIAQGLDIFEQSLASVVAHRTAS